MKNILPAEVLAITHCFLKCKIVAKMEIHTFCAYRCYCKKSYIQQNHSTFLEDCLWNLLMKYIANNFNCKNNDMLLPKMIFSYSNENRNRFIQKIKISKDNRQLRSLYTYFPPPAAARFSSLFFVHLSMEKNIFGSLEILSQIKLSILCKQWGPVVLSACREKRKGMNF